MANIKKKSISDIRGAATMMGGRGYEKAARDYVNSGLKELDLKKTWVQFNVKGIKLTNTDIKNMGTKNFSLKVSLLICTNLN